MATKRLPMRHIREILRLKWFQELSHRDTATSIGISPGAVGAVVGRAKLLNLNWEQIEKLDDEELETLLYGPKKASGKQKPLPDPTWMHKELRRPGVTLELLHLEYLENHPDGYRYTAFCESYRKWMKHRGLSMRQIHKAGEKAFVDYSGKKPNIVDEQTGEVKEVELFVVALGASSLIYAEASYTQKIGDWIESHIRAFEYYGGVPALVVSDQLKSAVTRPCRYEPGLQRTYAEWGRHYNTALLPARTYKPKDKAKVERAVQIAQRWIIARLRNETFFHLHPLNKRIFELLEELNDRPMKSYGEVSRRELFENIERAFLGPLPEHRFVIAEWKSARVNMDYHVVYDYHSYSSPHQLSYEEVEIRATAVTIEIFHRGKRVASHRRSFQAGGYTTVKEHMPKSHQKHLEWTPTRLINWANTIGPNTGYLVTAILESRRHPEQGYRSCLGILHLAKRYETERLEAACKRALISNARSYRHVESILKHGLDRVPIEDERSLEDEKPLVHANVRGPKYYN